VSWLLCVRLLLCSVFSIKTRSVSSPGLEPLLVCEAKIGQKDDPLGPESKDP